ncbi:hypothetical protein FQN57_005304 [Myotisia sp. PD_48]|nr:hypothetical protein FQN57_005304 [Myotisia sp. PD_48]
MTLKRKASFSTIISPRSSSSQFNGVSPVPCMFNDAVIMDETPRHLHSRTRKRFRNDRPEDQVVYDNTLRWLFSAQKTANNEGRSQVLIQNEVEPTTMSEDFISPPFSDSKPDSSQKTLLHFFQPSRQSQESTCQHTLVPRNIVSNANSSMCSDSGSGGIETDIDMQMDVDSSSPSTNSSFCQEKTWVGGIGWM